MDCLGKGLQIGIAQNVLSGVSRITLNKDIILLKVRMTFLTFGLFGGSFLQASGQGSPGLVLMMGLGVERLLLLGDMAVSLSSCSYKLVRADRDPKHRMGVGCTTTRSWEKVSALLLLC